MLRPMRVKLYALSASHPVAAVEAALRLKGIECQRIDLLPIVPVLLGPLRYGGTTVPGLRIDGERLAGSRTIMHRLEELVPEPPLLPAAELASYFPPQKGEVPPGVLPAEWLPAPVEL